MSHRVLLEALRHLVAARDLLTGLMRGEIAPDESFVADLTEWLASSGAIEPGQETGEPLPDGPGYVYFVRAGVGGPIKIGQSRNPSARLAQLQVSCPYTLVPIATVPGGEELEKALHEALATDRTRGEWFQPTRRVIDTIRGVVAVKNGLQTLETPL